MLTVKFPPAPNTDITTMSLLLGLPITYAKKPYDPNEQPHLHSMLLTNLVSSIGSKTSS